MKFRIHKILKNTKVEGPGTRYCIWFQGCSKHCKGCWAEATWDFDGGYEADTNEIISEILSTKNIEGVTFLGGEPFEQPEALTNIAKNVHNAGLSVLCFTGKTFAKIQQTHPETLRYIDLLIDGEYKEELKDYSRPWVGSSNQQYHFLSNRYDETILAQYKNKIEVNIEKNGTIFVNGMGDFEEVSKGLKISNYYR